jgi:hypothetical protein
MIDPKPKRRRNRQRPEPAKLRLFDLDAWRSDPSNISWAQTDPRFRDVISVLVTERKRAQEAALDRTQVDNRHLGRFEGYELALQVLSDMTTGTPVQPASLAEPTYEPANS